MEGKEREEKYNRIIGRMIRQYKKYPKTSSLFHIVSHHLDEETDDEINARLRR